MMKKNSFIFLIFLIIPSILEAAPRLQHKRIHHQAAKNLELTKHLYKNIPSTQFSEKDKDYLIFTNVMAIFVNAVKYIMDRDNVPESSQNAYNAVNGVINLINVLTRSALSRRKQEELAFRIIEAYDHSQKQHYVV
jgi:hypothetical protein